MEVILALVQVTLLITPAGTTSFNFTLTITATSARTGTYNATLTNQAGTIGVPEVFVTPPGAMVL